jgi:hypothetical protein
MGWGAKFSVFFFKLGDLHFVVGGPKNFVHPTKKRKPRV